MNPARIMALGDVHGDWRFSYAAIDRAVASGAEVILQVGDFGIWTHHPGGLRFLDLVEAKLAATGITLIFCDGNHENFDHLEAMPIDDDGFRRVRDHIWHAPRGHTWLMSGLRIGAFGGAHSIDGPGGIWTQVRGPGENWWPQESITQADVKKAVAAEPVDIMITHEVPEGIAIPGIAESYPLAAIQRRYVREVVNMWRPQVLFCGHYHRRHSSELATPAYRTRVEILAANITRVETGSVTGAYLLVDTDPFTLLLEE